MENNSLKQAMEERKTAEQQKQHEMFLENMNNKTFSELNLSELQFIYNTSDKLYKRLMEDKTATVQHIQFYEAVKQNTEQAHEEAEQELSLLDSIDSMYQYDDSWIDSFIDNQIGGLF